MRIVESNGRYAIAKGRWIFTHFLDLKTPRYWWTKSHKYYGDCWGTLEEVEDIIGKFRPEKWKTFRKL